MLARVREAEGRKAEARQLLAEALRMQPKSFDILIRFRALCRPGEPLERFRGAAEARGRGQAEQPAVLMKLAVEYMQIGELERARVASKRLYDLEPENPDAQYVYGRILQETQRFQEILDPLARKMVAQRPNDPHALFLLGMLTTMKVTKPNHDGSSTAACSSILRTMTRVITWRCSMTCREILTRPARIWNRW